MAVLEGIEANLEIIRCVRHLTDPCGSSHGKSTKSYWIMSHFTKILENFWLALKKWIHECVLTDKTTHIVRWRTVYIKGIKTEKCLLDEGSWYCYVTLSFPDRVRDKVSTVQRTKLTKGQKWVFKIVMWHLMRLPMDMPIPKGTLLFIVSIQSHDWQGEIFKDYFHFKNETYKCTEISIHMCMKTDFFSKMPFHPKRYCLKIFPNLKIILNKYSSWKNKCENWSINVFFLIIIMNTS